MKVKIPSVIEFNAWTPAKKLWWINTETAGKFKGMIKANGYFPMLVYAPQNVGIVYEVNKWGELIKAEAMTVKEALDRLSRFHEACMAMMATN